MSSNSLKAQSILNSLSMKNESPTAEHVLPYAWTIWHHSRARPSGESAAAEEEDETLVPPAVDLYLQTTTALSFPSTASQGTTDKIASVEQLWQSLALLKRAPTLPTGTEFLIFKHGVQPVWEDPVNTKGGRWVFRFTRRTSHGGKRDTRGAGGHVSALEVVQIRKRTSLIWERLVLRLLGGSLVPGEHADTLLRDISGLVLSVRKDEDIISVWNSNTHFDKQRRDEEDTKKLTSFSARRILCDAILRIIREADLIMDGADAVHTTDPGSNDRVQGVSFEYRLHSEQGTPSSASHGHRNRRDEDRKYSRKFNKRDVSAPAPTTIDQIIGGSQDFSALGRTLRKDDEDEELGGLLSFSKRRLQQQREKENKA
ncbi:hypothetical protein BABINDRAFT_161019 [Babjeviella inositovora NRRL Y-12698]|uniref:Uncharacterized protein n=1 Tax=Babjeviella inositovora NRRL Y-12698 TaxID=984486 RepID=A0A1E3QSX1_9ASCO|nr:uncharacterized protein BABINDRAFT_161019 [Babjeviella inositovora NRRL Y-12698]ODQ80813.1 hypothetical protein BABINDRAFT_161019 [Babjeviella inositovora NRRL Y-12698]